MVLCVCVCVCVRSQHQLLHLSQKNNHSIWGIIFLTNYKYTFRRYGGKARGFIAWMTMQQQDIRYSYWCCVTIWMMILSVRTTLTFEYNHNELSLSSSSSSSWPSSSKAFLQISERIIICCLTMSKPQLFPPLWQGISNNDELWTHFRGSLGGKGLGWVGLHGCETAK